MNKIDVILETLREEIRKGIYRVGDKFPSQYELSLRFEVNPKTANKAVSLLAAQGLLERQRRGQGTRVRSARSGYSSRAVVFLGPLNSEYIVRAVDGIQVRARREDLPTMICTPPPQQLTEELEKLAGSGILGIITSGYGRITVRDVPVVYLDPSEPGPIHHVTGENYRAGKEIVRAFTERGHRDIVALFSDSVNAERKRGVLEGLLEAGIKDARSRVYSALNYSLYETRQFLEKMRKKFPHYTAVIGGTDFLALNVYRLLPEISPEKAGKIGLSGFGNLRSINDLIPMATVDQHPLQMGTAAVEMLLSLASGRETAFGTTVPMEVTGTGNIPILLQASSPSSRKRPDTGPGGNGGLS